MAIPGFSCDVIVLRPYLTTTVKTIIVLEGENIEYTFQSETYREIVCDDYMLINNLYYPHLRGCTSQQR